SPSLASLDLSPRAGRKRKEVQKARRVGSTKSPSNPELIPAFATLEHRQEQPIGRKPPRPQALLLGKSCPHAARLSLLLPPSSSPGAAPRLSSWSSWAAGRPASGATRGFLIRPRAIAFAWLKACYRLIGIPGWPSTISRLIPLRCMAGKLPVLR